jgi:hypothetical protein
MAERMHFIHQREQHARMTFDGPPLRHGEPLVEKPVAPPAEPYRVQYRIIEPANTDAAGEVREVPAHVLRMPDRDAVAALVALGWRNCEIADALDLDQNQVAGIKCALKKKQQRQACTGDT